MTTSLAVVAERPGPLDRVLVLKELPEPGELARGEVAVRMLAAAVNPSDAVTVSGAYASRTSFPLVPGFEGVGVVERIGPGVDEDMVGRRVLPIGSAGCWARVKKVDASWCVPVPDGLSNELACFAYVNPVTAWLMVDRFCSSGVREVAITAATSTIAGHLAELLAERGIRPIGLVRGASRRDVAERSLWREVISTADPDWRGRLSSASGGRLDIVLDCVGGKQGAVLLDRLAPGGVLVHYGLLSGEPLPVECFDGRAGKRVEMLRLRDAVHSRVRHELPALLQPVFERMLSGRLLTTPVRRVALSGLPAALREEDARRGKVLVDCQQ